MVKKWKNEKEARNEIKGLIADFYQEYLRDKESVAYEMDREIRSFFWDKMLIFKS